MRWVSLIFLLGAAGCTVDPLRRGADEFPPKVPRDAPDGSYPTRRGWVFKHGGVGYYWEF